MHLSVFPKMIRLNEGAMFPGLCATAFIEDNIEQATLSYDEDASLEHFK
jgi:hypothetical protein